MTEAQEITHEERHRALVERLAANLKPVRPLWPVRVRLGLWLLLQVAVLGWVASHTPNDFTRKLESPRYLLEVVLFAATAILAAVIALRSAIPGRPVRIGEFGGIVVLLLTGSGLVMTQPMRSAYPLSEFVSVGLGCCDVDLPAGRGTLVRALVGSQTGRADAGVDDGSGGRCRSRAVQFCLDADPMSQRRTAASPDLAPAAGAPYRSTIDAGRRALAALPSARDRTGLARGKNG